MAIWLKPKARPNERATNKKLYQPPRLCRICGKPTNNGSMCQSCYQFIVAKKKKGAV